MIHTTTISPATITENAVNNARKNTVYALKNIYANVPIVLPLGVNIYSQSRSINPRYH